MSLLAVALPIAGSPDCRAEEKIELRQGEDLTEALFSGLELQYMSSRKTLAGNRASANFLTNLTLFSQHLTPGLEISGTVCGEHKQDIIGQDGRAFRLKMGYRF